MLANERTRQEICLREEWQDFITSGKEPEHMELCIVDSWKRSKEYGINPYNVEADMIPDKNELTHLLRKYEKLIRVVKNYTDKIYEIIQDLGYLICLTDNEGTIIYLKGDTSLVEEFNEKICFRIGARWNEKSVGTTAVSMALSSKTPVSFISEEKYCLDLKTRACSAVPIKDTYGNILGVLGIAANFPWAKQEIYSMLIIAAEAIENHLKMMNTAEEIRTFGSYYKTILDSVSDGVIVVDKKGLLININRNAEKIFSVSGENTVGRPVSEVFDFGDRIVDIIREGFGNQEDEFTVGYDKNGVRCKLKNSVHVVQRNGKINGVVDIINIIQDDRAAQVLEMSVEAGDGRILFDNIVGKSKAILEAKRQARLASASPVSVLITGETGTGKELFAQAMHNEGFRPEGPFIAINCGAIPKELMESELFGYEDGAFTGARRGGRPGKFELASGGTIFLDEIGEMPLDMQVKLLRVLQQKSVVRIGGSKNIPVDAKIISATNQDLIKEINEGRFRQDLYWRINVIKIHVPSLAEREGDIGLLAGFFMKKYNRKYHNNYIYDKSTLKALDDYAWPGNVRELENALLRAVTFAQGDIILPQDLPENILIRTNEIDREQSLSLADNEKRMIETCLHGSGGNIYKTAKTLGISRNTLYSKLKKYNIEHICV